MLALAMLASASLPAQVSPAGSWRTAHSTHFRVHYRPGADSLAAHAAWEAERAYTALSAELVPPRQAVDLILSDAGDFPNGSARVFPTNRITLLVTPPANEPELANYDDWLRLLISHELTHIFHLDRVKGPWAALQTIMGRLPGSFPNTYQPSWVAEGLATYYESRLTGRGRVYGSFHTQLLVSAAQGERWLSAGESNYISPRWPNGLASYAYGSRFFAKVAADAGDSVIPRFIEKTSGQWIPFRTGHALNAVSGVDRDSIWQRMKQDYQPRDSVTAGAEVIADHLRDRPSPAVSANGTLAWFEAPNADPPSIVVRSPDGETHRYRTTGGVDLAWRADTLYATWLNLADPFTYRSDLHRLVNGRWEQVTHNQRLTEVGAGQSGVVAVQLVGEGNRLVMVESDSIRPLSPAATNVTWANPTMLGGLIMAVIRNPLGDRVVTLHTPALVPVAWAKGQVNETLSDPTNGDGLFMYVGDRGGLPQVYGVTEDSTPGWLTDEPTGASQPAVSSDGWLYYTTLAADGYALKRIRLTFHPGDEQLFVPFESTPLGNTTPIPVRFTGYDPWPALRPHYFIPLAIRKGSAGTFYGLLTSGTDPVGRLGYTLQLSMGNRGARLDGAVSIFYQPWAHTGLDLYAAQDWGDAGVIFAPTQTFVRGRERDVELGVSNQWRGWYKTLSVRLAGHYEQDHFESSPALSFVDPEFGGASLSLGLGAYERPPLAISSEDGFALGARYRRRWRMDLEGWSEDWRGRISIYEAIKGVGLYAHPVLAGRVAAATSRGPDKESYGVGGQSGIVYQPLPGVPVGSGRQFPVRGYESGETKGSTAMVATAELRVPLALVAKPLGGLPYGLDRLSLSLFYDYGRVWRRPRSGLPRDISSTGVELNWDLVVLYDVPLRLRTGLAVPLEDGSVTGRGEAQFSVSFGSEF